ncbi:hypothetical protein DERF_014595, partial [Dermatophagoides farinae]
KFKCVSLDKFCYGHPFPHLKHIDIYYEHSFFSNNDDDDVKLTLDFHFMRLS